MHTPRILELPARGEPFRAGSFGPAVNLTEDLPQGADADILLLGGGDIRHIFHTVSTESFLPKRKLDVTSCEIDENVIGKTSLPSDLEAILTPYSAECFAPYPHPGHCPLQHRFLWADVEYLLPLLPRRARHSSARKPSREAARSITDPAKLAREPIWRHSALLRRGNPLTCP